MCICAVTTAIDAGMQPTWSCIMSTLLIAIIGLLFVLIAALLKVWVFDSPKRSRHNGPDGAHYAGHDALAERHRESSRRNHAWDAAVAKARNRFH
jgi:hypothetical protein